MGRPNASLQIDYQARQSLAKVIPKAPVLTSQDLGLRGIEIQAHHQPAAEMPEHISDKHIVAIHHAPETLWCERAINGQRRVEKIEDGQVVIIPAHTTHSSAWKSSVTATVIVLEPEHLAQLAPESIQPDQVELLPTFSTFDPVIHQIGGLLQSELTGDSRANKLYVESLVTALSAHLLRRYCKIQPRLEKGNNGLSKYLLQRALDYIEANLSNDVSLQAIADEIGMSRYYFCRLFKQSMGVTPHAYLTQQRLERSKELLNQHQLPISEISLECGFANPSHFARCFRKYVGLSPKQFRMI